MVLSKLKKVIQNTKGNPSVKNARAIANYC